jgi:tetratricopeptide (TPR) repeat protein
VARPRVPEPALPEEVTGRELDREVRAELRTLGTVSAQVVARHLVMAGRLIDVDPEQAWQHAAAAARRAGRIGAVREAAGLTAYAAGHFAEAQRELRAAMRLSGTVDQLPLLADCERGLGRPKRALTLASSADVARLDHAGRIEMRIVAAGARRDMGQLEAALATLQGPELEGHGPPEALARLWYAYADTLAEMGRTGEALEWFERVAGIDTEGETDAEERVDALRAARRPRPADG